MSWLAALGGLGSVGQDWAGNFFSQHQSQSAQSYSAAVARDLGLMNQYFTYNNMTYAEMLQELLNQQSYGYNTELQKLQTELQKDLNKSGFKFDKKLAEYSQLLNKKSADEDYARSVAYVHDALLAHKDALIQAGYNPLLALGSSAAQYSGHTNGVSAGSISGGAAGLSSVSAGSGVHGSSSVGGSVGTPTVSAKSSSLAEGLRAGIDLAKSASEIENTDANTAKAKADAVESVERAKSEAMHRGPTNSKIESETVNNYGKVASGIVGSLATAWGASKAGKAIKTLFSNKAPTITPSGSIKPATVTPAQATAAVKTATHGVTQSATSANMGSNMIRTMLPFLPLFSGSALVGKKTGEKGMDDARKGATSGDEKWYDKWRRVYFPMTGGM